MTTRLFLFVLEVPSSLDLPGLPASDWLVGLAIALVGILIALSAIYVVRCARMAYAIDLEGINLW